MSPRSPLRTLLASGFVVAGAAALAPACKGSSPSPVPLGDGCTLNSDCDSPLVCVFSRCHEACRVDTDCVLPEVCVSAGQYHVCTLPGEATCPDGGGCPGNLVCGADDICRNQCATSSDCDVPGLTCSSSKTCVAVPEAGGAAEGGGGKGDAGASGPDATVDGPASADGATPFDAFVPSADAGPLGFVASNLPPANVTLSDGGDGGLTISASCIAGAVGCPLGAPTTITQNDGSPADLYVLSSLTIDTTAALTLTGPNPIILAVLGPVEIHGTLGVAANLYSVAGPGGFLSGVNSGPGAGIEATGSYAGSGGGGASYCGVGGSGSVVKGAACPGGATYGNATITPLLGGSAGGTIAGVTTAGAGGGAIQIVSAVSITVGPEGVVNAGGGGAGGGNPAGGGSGGAILLEAPQVTIAGTLAANGGGGGYNGANATGNAQPASGGLDLQSVVVGGSGSAGATTAGSNAVVDATNAAVGGGGGGAGWIRINTASGSATITGTISPAQTTSCFSVGKLGG